MFDAGSRYIRLELATHRGEDSREIAYVKRRFLPRGSAMPVLVEVEITEGDRIDLVTSRTLGDPEQFWRVCDANDAMSPLALTERVGQRIRVPIPQFEGL